VITGPDGGAAVGHGRLRASHADREQVIDTLKTAFADSRLDKDELDARVGQALAARTYAELAAATADIPAGPPAAVEPAGTPSAKKFAAWSLGGWAGFSGALLALALLSDNEALAKVALVLMLCSVMSSVAVVLLAVSNQRI